MFPLWVGELPLHGAGTERGRARPDRVRGDETYWSGAIRSTLRTPGIVAVIPDPSNQIGHRKRPRPGGGRPPTFEADNYENCSVVESSVSDQKKIARHRVSSLPSSIAEASPSSPLPFG
jgi:hypothetical protein